MTAAQLKNSHGVVYRHNTYTYKPTDLQRLLLEGAVRKGEGPVQEGQGAGEQAFDRLARYVLSK